MNVPLGCLVATKEKVDFSQVPLKKAGIVRSTLLSLDFRCEVKGKNSDGKATCSGKDDDSSEVVWLESTVTAVQDALGKMKSLPENEDRGYHHFYLDVAGVENFKAGGSVEVCEKVRGQFYEDNVSSSSDSVEMRYVAPRAWQESEYHFSERRRQTKEQNL